jgi:hypothetical protein
LAARRVIVNVDIISPLPLIAGDDFLFCLFLFFDLNKGNEKILTRKNFDFSGP